MTLDHAIAPAAAVMAALMLAAPGASAQRARECTTIESNAERLACYDCAAIAADAERLACYDRALAAPAQQPIVRTAPRESRSAAPPPAESPPAAAAPAQPPAAVSIPPAPQEPARGPEATRDPVTIVVVGVRALQGRSRFTTADGEIWVQTDGRPVVLPEPPFNAELRPGSLSSFFLVPTEGARAIRVRRAD